MAEQNNGYQQNKVTTTGLTLFDENGIMLKLAYLDDSLSLMIGEPRVADNGKRTYPQETRYPFILTMDRAAALYENIVLGKVLPAIENGTNYNGGVFLNRRNDAIFEIRVQNGDVYLVYYKEIGEDRVAKSTHVFKCQKTTLIEKYATDGSHFEKSEAHSFFMLFCKYLESGVFDMNNSSTHSFRRANHYTTNKIFNYLEALAAKLGVSLENRSYQQAAANAFMDMSHTDEDGMPFSMANTTTTTTLDGILS